MVLAFAKTFASIGLIQMVVTRFDLTQLANVGFDSMLTVFEQVVDFAYVEVAMTSIDFAFIDIDYTRQIL